MFGCAWSAHTGASEGEVGGRPGSGCGPKQLQRSRRTTASPSSSHTSVHKIVHSSWLPFLVDNGTPERLMCACADGGGHSVRITPSERCALDRSWEKPLPLPTQHLGIIMFAHDNEPCLHTASRPRDPGASQTRRSGTHLKRGANSSPRTGRGITTGRPAIGRGAQGGLPQEHAVQGQAYETPHTHHSAQSWLPSRTYIWRKRKVLTPPIPGYLAA